MEYIVRRIAAYFIDYLCIMAYAGALLLFVVFVLQAEMAQDGDVGVLDAIRMQAIGLMTLTLPVVLVFSWLESGRLRATPGKLALSLRVSRGRGEPLRFPRSLARNALKFLPWEVAHVGVNQAFVTAHPIPWLGFTIAWISMLLVTIYLVSCIAGGGRTVYDRLVDARVG